MTPDRWQQLIDKLEDEGKIESRETEELEGRPGSVLRVIVNTPMGRIRLSYSDEPKKISEKALYSKRGGSTMTVRREYDEDEIIHVFSVERQDQMARWVHIDPGMFV